MKLRILLLVAVLLAIAVALIVFNSRETPETALKTLQAQHIEINEDNFIAEIQAGHNANVHAFIVMGTHAGTQNKEGTSALLAASVTGNEEIISMLIATLPSDMDGAAKLVNLQDNTGRTALLAATERADVGLITQLLAHGGDLLLTNQAGETPLMFAIKHRVDKVIPVLIDADIRLHHSAASAGKADASGDSPLVYAIRQQNPALVKQLLDAKADAVSADPGGVTPLMVAAETGDEPVAGLLLAAGAKTDTADRFGNTPLTIAIRHAHPAFATFLINHGADLDFHAANGMLPLQAAIETEPFDPDQFNYLLSHSKQVQEVASPLLFGAVDRKNPQIVKTLLGMGLSPQISNASGETLLYHAIEAGNEEVVLMLIDKGVDVNQTGVAGTPALVRAVQHNETQVVKKLLDMGGLAEQKTAEGYTLAEMAVYRGYPDILSTLLAHGARLQKDFAILWSIRDGGGRSVPVLLNNGANPNVMNENGEPALWLAASAGEVEAVSALIAHHVNLNYPNKSQGMSPLAIAAHTGQLGAVKLLAESGAKLEATDNFGMTPLAHAAYMTKPDVVEYLLAKGANPHAVDKQQRSIADLAALAAVSQARDRVMQLVQKK